ncbi:ABC transporter ATP-binding protein [Campylobacter ureolyticus]|uniref:ABC transporter ATP-binding protein n=1 Tax=Campylobacter ureolyticus TaxID=827 RepID=UPI0022B5B9F7|nr:ABC transporter ATP-binding protein [Campylobacter ureolyticus]MCZ6110556.1 ABC transporter ATP-binding protein [Campylobacter ureolyticus]MCZ6133140.1 ABC transporter ATP-binding protein [Campylobacter ureolyticus]MCZ6174739.1 ABC transporter ATP-binding protein [Campylobacter ureolyticus]MCZ6185670.1 ABC transporter ATP-binding protein [Campylobacter ureolyticus]
MELLKSVGLKHSFDYTLFENLNLTLLNKQSLAILGVSGCGKSTLLHILSTLLEPDEGEVFYKNISLYSQNTDEKLKIRRHDFGIIFQSHYLFKGFSAYENIELSTILTKQKMDNELFKKLKIENILNQKVGELSGGQQQRVSIARVLSKKPSIIFADEPTGNLDKDTANDVMNTLFDYIKNTNSGLILVTHDEKIASNCDEIYRLENKFLKKIN